MKKLLATLLCLAMLFSFMSVAAADEEVTLTVMNVQSADDAEYNALLEQFSELYPNIKINHISTVNAELKKQVQIDAISGNMPDVLQFDNPDYAAFAAGGYLMDITDLVADWEDMPHYWKACTEAVSYNGRLYGLPWECNCIGLWYNKTLLDELGKEVPVTWDDVLDICVAAKEKGYYGFAIPVPASEVGTFEFIPWLYAAGGSIEKLDSEESIYALNFLANLTEQGYMTKEVLGYSHGDMTNAFLAGNTVLMCNGSWCIANLAGATFEYGATTLPVLKAGDTPTNCLGGYHVGISADCKNVDAALTYLKFICSAEVNGPFAAAKGLLPTSEESAQYPAFSEGLISDFVAGLPGAIARVNPNWPDMSVNVYTAIQAALSGEKTAEQAMKDAQELNAQYWN